MHTVNERSTAYLVIQFKDKDGAAATPTAVSYHIHCVTNDKSVRAATAVSPSDEIEIALNALDTSIINRAKQFEVKDVFVKATFAENDELNEVYQIQVRNLGGV